ncbi:unnamed protein product [Aspergillus oryzae RIB40]|uniref:DNA, SC111 n=2 Tax=Aspergillus oryzae TaxID=5062 RepID=Q2U8T7_ASPOR|nr:unnamed protein product [Aspergillus oryzae RIB40]EIT80720.1 hypothetical protein Ao3042_02898 [Aspergillus oryzae 3.042]KDE81038.1 hypothetical protein AO1008_07253 [Aspergillus oryzae 100-8]BAE62028.1 unnamed protein product [Aspergillus oryzae RIB40]|eukprot:EIT80720.1 hypothetical protein Ao3042_02898 [Aspergillus oryzae 3.042]
MKLFISSILSIGCLAKIANASLGALNNPGLFPFVFNGVAVFNYPNWTTQQPRDSIKEGENFFCYATETGYLSFGCYSHCRPDSPDFVCDANLALPELGTLSTFYRDEEQGASAISVRRRRRSKLHGGVGVSFRWMGDVIAN